MCTNILYQYDIWQLRYIKTNFPPNLNYDENIVREMGPRITDINHDYGRSSGINRHQATSNHYVDAIGIDALRESSQIARIMGPTWGTPESRRPQVGPM